MDLGLVLTMGGIAIPLTAFLWEFAVAGRKQLGYRVQMDTQITADSNVPPLLGQGNIPALRHPSLVLVRFENSGTAHIDSDDYAVAPEQRAGLHIHFPGRRVVGMVVTECVPDIVRTSFGDGSPFARREETGPGGSTVGVIDLPKAPLNRRAQFKVLALLERIDDGAGTRPGQVEPPRVVGGIKGGVGRAGILRTRAIMGLPLRTTVLTGVLVFALFELSRLVFFPPIPLDCATGQLTLTGSTAFAPVVQQAADSYARACPNSGFTPLFAGSADGLRRVDQAESSDVVAFSDGVAGNGFPELLPRPTAFALFAMVVNPQAGVRNLSLDQIRQIYDGQIANWREVGGNDLPVRLVSRESDSGTRRTLQQRLLDGRREPGSNSDDCLNVDPGAEPGVIRCERSSTTELLDTVASTPGALGYSEFGAAAARQDLQPVQIDGQEATLEAALGRAYPFWQTEYAYTYGQPGPTSLAASFLRYLTDEVGRDIIRSHGLLPCGELANPVMCSP